MPESHRIQFKDELDRLETQALGALEEMRHDEGNATYVSDPHRDREAVEQITRRCEARGTALTISGSDLIVWKES